MTTPTAFSQEQATLGSILLNRDAIIPIAPWLTADDFADQRNAWIYQAMLSCYQQRIPPDVQTVLAELERSGKAQAVGGIAGLLKLSDTVPTSYHVEYYASTVKAAAIRRRLAQAGEHIRQIANATETDVVTALGDAQAELAAVTASDTRNTALVPLGELYETYRVHLTAERQPGVMSGLADLDALTGGWQAGDLIILAARPAVGKTSFALQVAYHAATTAPVCVFSLEMSSEQLIQRLLAARTGIATDRQRTGRLNEHEMTRIVQEMAPTGDTPLLIDDNGTHTVASIRASVLKALTSYGQIGLIVVDYLQLMEATTKYKGNRVAEVTELSRGLKKLAREVNTPVLVLSQLSRAVEGRQGHVPMLSDLRESGSIEQDADMVIFIHREELYDKETDKKGIAELHIAKHRNGPVGVISTHFDPARTWFSNLVAYRDVEGY